MMIKNEFVPTDVASKEANISTIDRDNVESTSNISSAESDLETFQSQISRRDISSSGLGAAILNFRLPVWLYSILISFIELLDSKPSG